MTIDSLCITLSYLNICVCVCVCPLHVFMSVCCAFSVAVNYGLLLAPVSLSLPCHFKADLEVGCERFGEGWVSGRFQTQPDQHFPDNMFLFIHNEVWLSAGLHALAATAAALMACSKQKYVACLQHHCKHAHSHQVDNVSVSKCNNLLSTT